RRGVRFAQPALRMSCHPLAHPTAATDRAAMPTRPVGRSLALRSCAVTVRPGAGSAICAGLVDVGASGSDDGVGAVVAVVGASPLAGAPVGPPPCAVTSAVGGAPTAAATSSAPAPVTVGEPIGCAVASRRSTVCAGVRPVLRSKAAAPATCGAAIDVPSMHAYASWRGGCALGSKYVDSTPWGAVLQLEPSSASPPGAISAHMANPMLSE